MDTDEFMTSQQYSGVQSFYIESRSEAGIKKQFSVATP